MVEKDENTLTNTELMEYNKHLREMVRVEVKAALELQSALLKAMADLVEFRDDVTGGHVERTQSYLGALFGAMIRNDIYTQEIDAWDMWLILNSVQLHDVGKIAIRDSVLQKPGKLTDDEFEHIKSHAVFGERVIEKIGADISKPIFLEYAKIFAGSHHEKWDGSGYPRGLKGEGIPLQGRLLAIADVYDALVSERPYKKAFSHEQAVEIIAEGKGTHFDPVLVDMFVEVADEFKKISDRINRRE